MALPKTGVELVAEGASAYFATMDKASQSVAKFGDGATANAGKLSSFEQISIGALRRVGAMAVEFGAQALRAIGGFVSNSVQVAGDFEASVYGMQAVAGDSLSKAGYSFDDVRTKALQLGADTQFSAQEAITAMTELVKGGVPVKGVMTDATDATLALAAAAGTDLSKSAEIVAKQLGVWSERGVSAQQVTDLLASAANASTVGVEDLALGLANVGGTAKTAGVSYQDLVQTMALIAPNFSSAADAGTSLKVMISRLAPQTKRQTAMMAQLGLYTKATGSAFFDANGQFIGMQQSAQVLQNALAPLNAEQRLVALNTIFGQDAIRAASAFATAGAQGFDAMGQAMTDAGGAATAAAIKNQGYNFAMEQLKGSIETLQIVIGSLLLPVLTVLLGYFTSGVNQVMLFVQAISGSQTAMAQLGPTAQLVAGAVQAAVAAFGTGGLAGAATTLGARLQPLIPGAQSVGASIGQIITAAQPLIAIIQANLVPILGVLAGVLTGVIVVAIASAVAAFLSVAAPIALLVAAGAALYAAWQSNFMGIQGIVTNVLNAVWGVISAIIRHVVPFWETNGAAIQANTIAVFAAVGEVIGTAMQLIGTVVTTVLSQVAAFWQQHGNLILQTATSALNLILSIITTVLNLISGVFKTVIAIINGDWSGAWQELQNLSATFVQNILGVLENSVSYFANAANLMIEAIVSMWRSFGGWAGIGQGVIDGIADGIKRAAGALASAAANAAKAALDAAKSALGISSPSRVFAAEVGQPTVAGIIQGVQDMQPRLNATLSSLITPSMVRPAASVGQLAAATTNNYYYGQVGNSYQMPVYTTQSPAVIQNSFALAHAWSVR